MILQKMPPFLNVVATGKAIGRFPFLATLNRIVLALGGTSFTKAMITQIALKIGSRPVWECTGSRLDAINKYRGIADSASRLTIDFMERDARDLKGALAGAYDLTQIGGELTAEVDIAGATAPTLDGYCMLDAPQGNPLIRKLVYVPSAFSAGGKQQITWSAKGALIERLYHFHGGNMTALEVKKNGGVLFDSVPTGVNEFIQQEFRRVPQANLWVWDPVVDNNYNGAVKTSDARSFELNPTLSAADTIHLYAQVVDVPNNL